MKCKKCEVDFIPSKGLINYCSLACRNTRVFTDEAKIKKADQNKIFWRNLSDLERVERISKIHTPTRIKKIKETLEKKINEKPFVSVCFDVKRVRVIKEQENKCNSCGIFEWMGSPISLEIDHIDGNNKNNSRDNLEGLCPNCHSLTPTWRGRNTRKAKISDNELINSIVNAGSIRHGLLNLNMSPKGDNYGRAKRLLENSGLEITRGIDS